MAKRPGKKTRKQKRIPEPASYFIGTEGIKTEVFYFQAIANYLVSNYEEYRGRIEVPNLTIEGMGTSNFRIVKDTEEYLRNDPRLFENVWVLFDKDDVPDDYFDNSIKQAEKLGFKVAWSNDSFELWLLLHFEYMQSSISRDQYKEKLGNYLKEIGIEKYEKNSLEIMEFILRRRDTAIKNAARLEGNHSQDIPPSKRNPCTIVHHLVEDLLEVEKQLAKILAAERYS